MNLSKSLIYLTALSFFNPAWSQTPSDQPEVKKLTPKTIVTTKAAVGAQNFKIVYGSAPWNANSTQMDSAFLFLRDKASGKIVKILLEETEPDSSVFSGNFAVSWGQQGSNVEPQVYIPPRDMRNNDEALKKFNKLLADGKIQAKPLIVKTAESGLRTMDVYDTKDQVQKAQEAYDAEQRAKSEKEKTKLAKPIVKNQELEVAKREEQQKLINQLAFEAAQREAERVRIEQIERQKILERERLAREQSEKERADKKQKAAELAAQALAAYQNGDFAKAETLFKQTLDLDPLEKSYYFKYAVTLYRLDKFNDALVTMKVVPNDPATELEKQYYMGLIHLKLKELDPALENMKKVGLQKQSPLAASAAFYEGIIHFTKEDYSAAKEPFERVIDLSQDPRLDEQAEQYLDMLTGLIQQKKLMSKRIFMNGSIGTVYDSNVLYAPDTETSQGSAQNVADFRLQTTGDIEYRPFYTNVHEAGAKAMIYTILSSKDEASTADTYLGNLSLPYTYKGKLFNKGGKASFKPAFEMVQMDSNQDGTPELILQSIVLNMDTTLIMQRNWFANYAIELRNDDAKDTSSVGDANADAVKISLKTSQTLLLDKDMKRGIIGNAAYVYNQAQGKDKAYDRYELGINYMQPVLKDSTLTTGLSYYLLNFSKATTERKDNNMTFNVSLLKPYKEWVAFNFAGTYTNNASSNSSNQYSRYSATASAVFNYSL